MFLNGLVQLDVVYCAPLLFLGEKDHTRANTNFVLYSNCSLIYPSARDAFAFSKQGLKHN